MVPSGCQGSLQASTGRVGCRKPGRGTQAGLSKPAFNILIIVTRPVLFFHYGHQSFLLGNFREVRRVKVKAFVEVVKEYLRKATDPLS